MSLERLGPYVLIHRIGRGGMGTVYEARDERTNELVAVKVLNVSLADEESFRQRFDAEIETLKQLRHPNIVRLYGYGEFDGYVFYGMELVRGKNLEQSLHEGERYDWARVMRIGLDVAKALKHAHDRGVIHRDIKPANLLIQSDGVVKLTDFGIARLFGQDTGTNVGGVMGTAQFMAPEQVEGRPVTPSCDLYSLGGVLYSLLAGRPPFVAKTLPQMLHLQRFGTPESIRRFNLDCPKELDQLVLQLLAKDPKDRIATANVLLRQLQSMLHGLESTSMTENASSTDFGTGEDFASEKATEEGPIAETRIAPTTQAQSTLPGGESHMPTLAGPPPAGGHGSLDSTQIWEAPPKPPKRVFTEVGDEIASEPEVPEWVQVLRSPQVWTLILGLAGIGGIALFMAQGASPETLMARIEAAERRDPLHGLIDAEASISDFLRRYPQHENQPLVQDWQQEMELQKLDRSARRGFLRKGRSTMPSPAGDAYASAMRYMEVDPLEGAARLRGIVVLYEGAGADSPDGPFVELAQRQLDRLAAKELDNPDKQALQNCLTQRLAEAQRVLESDPLRARRIWEAIVTVYAHHEGVQTAVGEARRGLASLP